MVRLARTKSLKLYRTPTHWGTLGYGAAQCNPVIATQKPSERKFCAPQASQGTGWASEVFCDPRFGATSRRSFRSLPQRCPLFVFALAWISRRDFSHVLFDCHDDRKETMMPQATVVCPHCGSTGTYNHGHSTGNGSTGVQCRACHKTFRIYVKNGQVDQVKKS
jgi:hypothetical protein